MPSLAPEHIHALGESYARLWEEFSEFPTREEVSERIRVFKPKSLANLDCQGRGPAGRRLIAGKVCYHRDQVITWFAVCQARPNPRPRFSPHPGRKGNNHALYHEAYPKRP